MPIRILLFLLFWPCVSRAQFAAFPAPGMEYGSVYWCNPFDCFGYFNTSIRYVGDTVLCGETWNRFLNLPNLSPNYPNLLRAEQGKYYRLVDCSTQQLMYDFSKKQGDTVITADLGALKVIGTGLITLSDGSVRKKMTVRKLGTITPTYTWVDGVGDIERSFFRSSDWEGGQEQLVCVKNSAGLLHYNPAASLECDSLLCPVPQPRFEFSCTGTTFQFTNLSREADDYFWDFGDGETSSEENPSHTFAASGCYTVSLKAQTDCLAEEYVFSQRVSVDVPVFWKKAAYQPPAVFQKMQFLDDQKGWAISSKTIWKTSDGGVHWDSVGYPGPVRPVVDLQFKDFEHGIIDIRIPGSPYYSQILWTNDGVTWEVQPVDENPTVTAIERLNDSSAVIAAHYQGVFVTKDWGKTWVNHSLSGMMSLVFDFVSIGGDTVYFDGFNQIFQPYNTRFGRSFDLQDWDVFDMEVPQARGLDFVSPQKGWTINGTGIFQTLDGGLTWQSQDIQPYGLSEIGFADSLHGWACGHQSGIYGTNDGGQTWIQQACPRTTEHTWALGVRSPGQAYVMSKDGLLEFSALPDTASLCGTSGLNPISEKARTVSVYPNPSHGLLLINLSLWQGQQVQIQVLNAQGQLVLEQGYTAENEAVGMDLPEKLASGLYYLVTQPEAGQQTAVRFVLER